MPKAKSLIVCGFRIMRGSFRGVEEGTLFTNYSAMGYGFINQHVMPLNARDVAAYLAGLGEIGYSKVFLTPEFGPRVRFGMIMTEMELEPDPIMKPGTLCNRCMACVRECPGAAISATETVRVRLAGYEVEWGKLEKWRCSHAFRGGEETPEGEAGDYLV